MAVVEGPPVQSQLNPLTIARENWPLHVATGPDVRIERDHAVFERDQRNAVRPGRNLSRAGGEGETDPEIRAQIGHALHQRVARVEGTERERATLERLRVRERPVALVTPASEQAVRAVVEAEHERHDEALARVLVVGQHVPDRLLVGVWEVRPCEHDVVGRQVIQRRRGDLSVEEIDGRHVLLALEGGDQLVWRPRVRVDDEDFLRATGRPTRRSGSGSTSGVGSGSGSWRPVAHSQRLRSALRQRRCASSAPGPCPPCSLRSGCCSLRPSCCPFWQSSLRPSSRRCR